MKNNYKSRMCVICNKEFIPNRWNQKCCCTKCSEENYKRYDKERDKNIQRKIKHREYNKKYRENNKEKVSLSKKKCIQKHKNTYRLSEWSRKQIRRCLNSNKTEHTFDILGYTPEQLKQRLEMNFMPDMNWSNHGILWHIDHRKPLCKFNFVLPDGTPNYEQIRLANSLANLQPLHVTENLSKGGR